MKYTELEPGDLVMVSTDDTACLVLSVVTEDDLIASVDSSDYQVRYDAGVTVLFLRTECGELDVIQRKLYDDLDNYPHYQCSVYRRGQEIYRTAS